MSHSCSRSLSRCVFAASANASQLIDRNAHDVQLAVDAKGEALITYTAGGKLKHVLAWDAVNAIAPTHARAQVAFKLDYAGGWGKYAHRLLEDVRRARAAPTTARRSPGRSPRARRPTARTGRCSRGSGCCRTTAATRRAAGGVGASPLALDRRPAGAHDRHRLGLAPVGSPVRDVHLRRPAGLRLQVDLGRQSARLVRPQHLRRHVRLGVRRRLEAREQLPRPQRHRRLLLQLQPARLAPGRQGRRSIAPRSRAPASRPT